MENESATKEFDVVLQPLDMVLELVLDNRTKPAMADLYEKYKEDLVKTKSGNEELKDLIHENSKHALSLLSKRYRTRLLQFYNYDGLAYYTYVHTNRLTMLYLEELMST